MPSSTKQKHKNITVLLCKVTNVLITSPLKTTQTADVFSASMDCYIRYFGSPTHIICYQDQEVMSSLAQYSFQQIGTKILTVSINKHMPLLAEHGFKSLSNTPMKHFSHLDPI